MHAVAVTGVGVESWRLAYPRQKGCFDGLHRADGVAALGSASAEPGDCLEEQVVEPSPVPGTVIVGAAIVSAALADRLAARRGGEVVVMDRSCPDLGTESSTTIT